MLSFDADTDTDSDPDTNTKSFTVGTALAITVGGPFAITDGRTHTGDAYELRPGIKWRRRVCLTRCKPSGECQ